MGSGEQTNPRVYWGGCTYPTQAKADSLPGQVRNHLNLEQIGGHSVSYIKYIQKVIHLCLEDSWTVCICVLVCALCNFKLMAQNNFAFFHIRQSYNHRGISLYI